MAKKTPVSKDITSLEELKKLDSTELKNELLSAQKTLYTLKMQKDLGELKQTHKMKQQKKHIARISTFLSSSL